MSDRAKIASRIASVTGAPKRRVEKLIQRLSDQQFEEIKKAVDAGKLGEYAALTKLFDIDFKNDL